MGTNYVGIDVLPQRYRAMIDAAQTTVNARVPFSCETLNEYKETHALISSPPYSILGIRQLAPPGMFDAYEHAWYNLETFASERPQCGGWYLIRTNVFACSLGLQFRKQVALLRGKEALPRAAEVVYALVAWYLTHGGRLFERVQTRCADIDSDRRRVYVGRFDNRGIRINDGICDNDGRGDIGIASIVRSAQ